MVQLCFRRNIGHVLLTALSALCALRSGIQLDETARDVSIMQAEHHRGLLLAVTTRGEKFVTVVGCNGSEPSSWG